MAMEEIKDEVKQPETEVETEQIAPEEIEVEENTQETEESPEAEQAETDTENQESKSGGFFKRKKDKKDPRDEKIADLTDKLQRQMAEFDNYRKRTEKEKASMYVIGAKEIVEKILPVIDNFERGLNVPDAEKDDPFIEGMNMIYKQFMTTLDELGVKAIEAVGQPFDPNLHNAVMHVEDENMEENVVVEEFQKGYTYKDFVIRHSMVKVAN